MTKPLASWNEGASRSRILDFVRAVTTPGPGFVPPEERIATFDADGTLWCEKPAPVEADFILRRLADMAAADPSLRDRQPWKAAFEKDMHWLGEAITEHYAGQDAKAKLLLTGVGAAYSGISVEDFQARAGAFLRSARHPTLARTYLETAYLPMVELLDHLAANGFTNHIISGSGSDFMRPISQDVFGVPGDHVAGSDVALTYSSDADGGAITRQATLSFLDDGPEKPIQIWSRIGRRPILACGNSNGDIPMLEFSRRKDGPGLRLLILHDDASREFDYTSGAEDALTRAAANDWAVVSMKKDFRQVFGAPAPDVAQG